MTMDLLNPDVWISHLLENLPDEKLASALKDDNPDWEYIDGEIVKLGSLAHSQVDIPEIQRRGLQLLASESKDFRLLAHLLRTLQHAGNPLLALRLLALYVEHYWVNAAPHNQTLKNRFAAQVIKRFEIGITGITDIAETTQRDVMLGELAKLAQCWQAHTAPELAQDTDNLFVLFQRAFRDVAPTSSPVSITSGSAPQYTNTRTRSISQNTKTENKSVATSMLHITIDPNDEKAWRDALLNVAAVLCECQPDSPQGYRLRRYALWLTITSAPLAQSDGRTPLSPVPADMVAEYQAKVANSDMALWQQVEKSLLLAPYWLDGQYLSAQIALRFGYEDVALAIRDEAARFLVRLPALTSLLFNDNTPFISEQTKQWLDSISGRRAGPSGETCEAFKSARVCFHEQGLEAALRYLDEQPSGDPREHFHRQYLGAQLMEEAGMGQFAQQQYRMLFRSGQHMKLADWEPSLLEQLEQKFMAEQ